MRPLKLISPCIPLTKGEQKGDRTKGRRKTYFKINSLPLVFEEPAESL
jgi:hypothetical protein